MKRYIFLSIALFFASNSHADSISSESLSTGKCNPTGSFLATKYNVTLDECISYTDEVLGSATQYDGNTIVVTESGDNHYLRKWTNTFNKYSTLGNWYNVVEGSNYCPNEDYPTLSDDGLTCSSAPFEIDQTVIDEFNSIAEQLKESAIITNGDLDDAIDDLLNKANDVDELESDFSLSASQYNAIQAQAEIVTILASSDSTLQTKADEINSIAGSAYDDAIQLNAIVDEVVTEFEDGTKIYDSSDAIIGTINDNVAYYNDGTIDYEYSETQATADETIVSQGLLEDSINSDIQTVQDNTTSIQNSTSTVTTTISNSESLTESISNYYSESTTIYNEATGESVGDECVGDYCADEEEESYSSDLTHSDSDYESISDANTAFFNGLSSTPIIQASNSLQNLITVPSGSCPALSVTIDSFNKTISTNIHCSLFESYTSIFTTLFLILWSVGGFKVLFSA